MTDSIPELKARFRKAIITYRGSLEGLEGCGLNLSAVIRPEVGRLAREANEIGKKLKELDPEFPKSWQPYPEGK